MLKLNQEGDRVLYEKCPLCMSGEIQPLLQSDCTRHPLYNPKLGAWLRWSKCGECGHVFTEGYHTEDALKVLFGKTAPNQVAGHDLERARMISARMIERVLPHKSEGEWLDVGFGNASLLLTAKEFGFKPFGVDLRSVNVERARKMGVYAEAIDITELAGENRFTVISMADVLEHIPYPLAALKAVHRLLRKDGVFFLSMPNSECPAWDLTTNQNSNPYWLEIEHYHNFSLTRLRELLTSHGFQLSRYGVSERYRMCMEIVALRQ